MINEHELCPVCGERRWQTAYQGPIRQGSFGKLTEGEVYRCTSCEVEYLPPVKTDLTSYYQSGEYRSDVGESPDVSNYFHLHDTEQFARFGLLHDIPIRDRIIADVGCGGGSFLDGVHGFASQAIAIEPAIFYHDSLRQRGYGVYPDVASAIPEWQGQIDLATCFSVIEHVEQPVLLLQEMRSLLASDGWLLLSTPNRNDILLQLDCTAYRSFFYRTVHVFYFNEHALKRLASAAGFSRCEIRYVHRYNYSNFVGWLRDGRPTGNKGQTVLGAEFDRLWQSTLESRGVADYLYAYLRP